MKKLVLILFIFCQTQVFSQSGWTAMNTGTTNELYNITFINQNTGFVLAYKSSSNTETNILKTTNAGNSWSPVYTSLFTRMSTLKFINSNTGFAGPAQNGFLVKTTNGGSSWIATTLILQSGMCFVDSVNWYGINAGTVKTTNGGVNWFNVSTNGGNSFSFLNSTTGLLHSSYSTKVGAYAKNYYTTNGGINWITGTSAGGGAFVTGGILDIGFFYSLGGVSVSVSTNAGLNWTTSYPLTGTISAGQFINHTTGFVCGESVNNTGFISYTTNAGVNWTASTYLPPIKLNSIYFTSNLTGYVCGVIGGLFKTTTGGVVTGFSQSNSELPDKFSLSQNYPNPFNPTTRINYELPITNYVSLKVYDALGNEIETLVNEKQNAGSYSVDFNATLYGSGLPSGIYFYKLVTEKFSETKKMILVK